MRTEAAVDVLIFGLFGLLCLGGSLYLHLFGGSLGVLILPLIVVGVLLLTFCVNTLEKEVAHAR